MESGKIRDSQIKASTFSTSGANMRGGNARLNSHGGWCVKNMKNHERDGKRYFIYNEKFHIPNEFLGK